MEFKNADKLPHPFDSMFPTEWMLQSYYVWQMPFLLGAAWWENLMPGWTTPTAFAHHNACHDEHRQLVVPAPLEDAGEPLVA